MKRFENIEYIFFIGIGGIGMSALAKYFKILGKKVSGYDRTPSLITAQLKELDIPVFFEDSIEVLPQKTDLVIYTPAIPSTHKQLTYFRDNGYPIKKRAEILGSVAQDRYCIAVAGTHGKTTTTALISHILHNAKADFMAFMGGISKNFNSNFTGSPNNKYIVAEADEYDKSFLQLHPDIAIITAMDADHLDIYGSQEKMIESYNTFASQIKKEGTLVLKHNISKKITNKNIEVTTYSLDEDSSYKSYNIRITDAAYTFDVLCPGNKVFRNLKLNIGGRHNIENAVAAIAVSTKLGIEERIIRKSLETFKGVLRRFDIRINHKKLIYIDDYAHHPEELKMFINSVREFYPGKTITGVFQPHLFSRTRDFADDFAKSLEQLDEVILLDIYPAREKPIEGITSKWLLDKITNKNKMLCTKEALIETLVKQKNDIILTIGAGDIDGLVSPITKSLNNILKYI